MEGLKQKSDKIIKHEIKKGELANKALNVIALLLIFTLLYLLSHFWNIGVAVAAVILMAGRLPDLFWEIKHGKKVDPKLMKKDTLYFITTFLSWVALPVLYFSLYHF